jgi:L-seryl-tRNA(Ser) seleniumtransferase
MNGFIGRVSMALSDLPSVSALLGDPRLEGVAHDLAVEVARDVLARERERLKAGGAAATDLGATVADEVAARLGRSLVPAINATGIPIHTNLGRAPLHPDAVRAVADVARGYAVVELERDSGRRGGRLATIERALTALTGAEAALAVNNNAAAVLLALTALARGKEVVVSRGELVEIGGSFRVPDVIAAGGAVLRDVGTTNRTRLEDYERAIGPETAVILRVHRSNFRIEGFTEQPERKALADLAHAQGLVLVEDLGSGMIGPPLPIGGDEEPVARSLEDGVDLACFSGDKLLGGPQAGLAIGRADVVAKLRSHPLYRALRLDKLVLAALEATLLVYRRGGAGEIPVRRMIARGETDIAHLADAMARRIPGSEVVADVGFSGGGALPGTGLPTRVVTIEVRDPEAFTRALRLSTPAIVARVHKGRVAIDPRCLLDGEADAVVQRVRELLDKETP